MWTRTMRGERLKNDCLGTINRTNDDKTVIGLRLSSQPGLAFHPSPASTHDAALDKPISFLQLL